MTDEQDSKTLRSHIRSYGAASTTAVGGVLVTISVYEEFVLARPFLLWVGLALVAVGVVAAIITFGDFQRLANFKTRTMKRVRRDATELRPLLPRLLKRVARDVGAVGSDFRLSLYQHQGDKFALVARHTENPELATSNRAIQTGTPAGGVLLKAWEGGVVMISMLPAPDVERKEILEHHGLPKEAHLTRSIAAVALSYDEKRVGILAVESTKPRGVSGHMVDLLRKNDLEETIAWMLGSLTYRGVEVDMTD